jgi:hypothetical protein
MGVGFFCQFLNLAFEAREKFKFCVSKTHHEAKVHETNYNVLFFVFMSDKSKRNEQHTEVSD